MPKINILDKNVSELIAAGEVIERPASIVKELLENCIDAGSTAITIEIKKGGISYIRITDNGTGIEKEDMPIAFLRHATSKVKTEEDLDKIGTLGFRGEALASISAVSKVEMMSKTKNDNIGNKISLSGGEIDFFEECGCPQGTTIIVKDLFYNVPARLKFLKKETSEGNAIQNIVEKIAISHPQISFKFIKENKIVLHTSGDGKLISAIYSVLGKDFAKSLLEVEYSYKGIDILGFITKPTFARSNRTMQHFFVNDRYVKSKTCMVSLEEAYKNSIMVSKFPGCVLMVNLDFSQVDVNVHPSKIEIRFSKEQDVFEAVYFAVKTSLNKNDILQAEKSVKDNSITKRIFSSNEDSHKQITIQTQPINNSSNYVNLKPEHSSLNKYKPNLHSKNISTFRSEPPKIKHFEINSPTDNTEKVVFNEAPKVIESISLEEKNTPKIKGKENDSINKNDNENLLGFSFINKDILSKKIEDIDKPTINNNEHNIVKEDTETSIDEEIQINVIGELFKTYILFEVEDNFVMLDKHAAHERIIFEKLKKDIELKESQILLIPIPILLNPQEKDIVENNISLFNNFGFDFEINEKECFIKSAPLILHKYNLCDIVLDIIENIISNKIDVKPEKFEDLLHSVACKSAIKANQDNNIEELIQLAKQVYFDKTIRHCPHGRPVGITMTKYDIEKQFGRV